MDDTTRGLLILGAVLLVVTIPFSIMTGGMMMSHMMGPGAPGGGGWMWGLGGLTMLLVWGVVVAGIVLLARSLGGRDVASPREPTALDVLKRRYASGELTREQYEAIRHDIEG